jgi:hydrogenase maturation protease
MCGKVLLLGLGNTIMSDDGAGIIAGRAVFGKIRENLRDESVEFLESSLSGWRLLDLVGGFDNVIVIDSLCREGQSAGKVFIIDDVNRAMTPGTSAHGTGVFQVLKASSVAGGGNKEIVVYAISVKDPYTFGEKLSVEVERNMRQIVDEIFDDIMKNRRVKWH